MTYVLLLPLVALLAAAVSVPAADRASHASSPAAGDAIRLTRPGLFFTATEQAARYEVPISIPAGVAFTRATISFGVTAPGFPGPALHSILEMINPSESGHQGRYFALQHMVRFAEEKGIRTNIDNMIGGFSGTRTDVLEKVRTDGGASLRYHLVYDTSAKSVTVEITDAATGVGSAFTETRTNKDAVLVEENAIRDTGGGLVVRLGLDRTYDHGGYYPPYGWSFSDLTVELTNRRQ